MEGQPMDGGGSNALIDVDCVFSEVGFFEFDGVVDNGRDIYLG